MFDVFYTTSTKPNLFPHEKRAVDIFDAAKQSRTKFCWVITADTDYDNFDFYWMPPKWEQHHTHVFGSQWQRNAGTYFIPANLTESTLIKNYRTEQRVVRKPCVENWVVPENIDVDSFDFSWHPDPDEPSYIHIFGTVWWDIGGPEYHCINAVAPKFHNELRAKTIPSDNWIVPANIDKSSFDFSWCPHPNDPPYIYKFGTQWQTTGGPIYVSKNATQEKYVPQLKAKAIPEMQYWTLDPNADYSTFDFSWHPDESQKDYKHVFPSQWQKTSETSYFSGTSSPRGCNYINDVRVHLSGINSPRYFILSTLEDLISEHPTEKFWALSKELNYDKFDFSWHPDQSQIDLVHVFASQWQQHSETYFINAPSYLAGNKELNYVADIKTTNTASLDMFFLDKGNKESAERFESLKNNYPQIQKTRLVNNLQQTAIRCANKCNTDRFWIISSEFVYDEFDFSWSPEPWELSMTHVFGSKWDKWTDTILLSRFELNRNKTWCEDIKDWPNLNFVKNQPVDNSEEQIDIWYLDHFNPESKTQLDILKQKYSNIKTMRFVDNYLDAITRCANQSETKYIWVISSICDYSTFDFSWHPGAWQHNMMHVFPSNDQKYGDTFYVPITEFKAQRQQISKLEDFKTVNYVSVQPVNRYDVETVRFTEETLPQVIENHVFSTNYALFLPEKYEGNVLTYTPNLWSGKDRSVHVLSKGAEFALVPKDVKNYFNSQIYDYPFITTDKKDWYQSNPLDIVFISNGESMANDMWMKLNEYILDKGFENRIVRVDGVNGRSAAYKAASNASMTPWAFNVFAKLEIDTTFDFNWQPDRLQKPKHYIFHAKNPVNGLEYGHQAVIAYNKHIVLGMDDTHGLDFTLSAEHEVVPMLSGVSHFNRDSKVCWRTAFRECIKLKYFADNGDYIAKERLDIWLNVAEGENADMCLKGAKDAITYYESVNGELSKLLLSFEWKWLDEYFKSSIV
jgi:hypothetical protein